LASATETIDWIRGKKMTAEKRQLSEKEFAPISEWYHFAVLGLAHLHTNYADAEWIARRLRISPLIAKLALEDLIRYGHLEIKQGMFRQTSEFIRTRHDLPSVAVRRFHRQVLELAAKKIEAVPTELREFSAMTLAINPKQIAVAKKLLRNLRDKFSEEISVGKKTEVYFFCTQFFPLTEGK
jgi:uncharacterized protein (TIGR02147 family)